MSKPTRPIVLVAAALVLGSCTTTTVTERQMAPQEKIARPERILVHDFAATATAIHAGSGLTGKHAERSTPPTSEELVTLAQLGTSVAEELVAKVREMGLPAVRAEAEPPARVGDLVLHGTFVSADEGSESERIVVGFGKGDAELQTVVEGYLMTENGLRRLGSGKVETGGGRTPGVLAPALITIATANPLGIVVGSGVKAYGELSGSAKIQGAGRRTADEIAEQLRPRFEQQGWIEPRPTN